MRIIAAQNVNDGYRKGLVLLRDQGVTQDSRAGLVRVVPFPVITHYLFPMERVLLDKVRDANPWFHLMESLWMLAGRNDATWLDQFVKDYSARFAENNGAQWGAYGYRWRTHFFRDEMIIGPDGQFPGKIGEPIDQLSEVITLLAANKLDRRAVIQMWDAEYDLGNNVKDVPCNLSVIPRIVDDRLDITVTCRSNDAIWGAYGSNAVHFSILQEYLAARIGVKVGSYYQLSNNFHAYVSVFEAKLASLKTEYTDPYTLVNRTSDLNLDTTAIVTKPDLFDLDLQTFFTHNGSTGIYYHNDFFSDVAIPMLESYKAWRDKNPTSALKWLEQMPLHSDWYVACRQWYAKRSQVKAQVE